MSKEAMAEDQSGNGASKSKIPSFSEGKFSTDHTFKSPESVFTSRPPGGAQATVSPVASEVAANGNVSSVAENGLIDAAVPLSIQTDGEGIDQANGYAVAPSGDTDAELQAGPEQLRAEILQAVTQTWGEMRGDLATRLAEQLSEQAPGGRPKAVKKSADRLLRKIEAQGRLGQRYLSLMRRQGIQPDQINESTFSSESFFSTIEKEVDAKAQEARKKAAGKEKLTEAEKEALATQRDISFVRKNTLTESERRIVEDLSPETFRIMDDFIRISEFKTRGGVKGIKRDFQSPNTSDKPVSMLQTMPIEGMLDFLAGRVQNLQAAMDGATLSLVKGEGPASDNLSMLHVLREQKEQLSARRLTIREASRPFWEATGRWDDRQLAELIVQSEVSGLKMRVSSLVRAPDGHLRDLAEERLHETQELILPRVKKASAGKKQVGSAKVELPEDEPISTQDDTDVMPPPRGGLRGLARRGATTALDKLRVPFSMATGTSPEEWWLRKTGQLRRVGGTKPPAPDVPAAQTEALTKPLGTPAPDVDVPSKSHPIRGEMTPEDVAGRLTEISTQAPLSPVDEASKLLEETKAAAEEESPEGIVERAKKEADERDLRDDGLVLPPERERKRPVPRPPTPVPLAPEGTAGEPLVEPMPAPVGDSPTTPRWARRVARSVQNRASTVKQRMKGFRLPAETSIIGPIAFTGAALSQIFNPGEKSAVEVKPPSLTTPSGQGTPKPSEAGAGPATPEPPPSPTAEATQPAPTSAPFPAPPATTEVATLAPAPEPTVAVEAPFVDSVPVLPESPPGIETTSPTATATTAPPPSSDTQESGAPLGLDVVSPSPAATPAALPPSGSQEPGSTVPLNPENPIPTPTLAPLPTSGAQPPEAPPAPLNPENPSPTPTLTPLPASNVQTPAPPGSLGPDVEARATIEPLVPPSVVPPGTPPELSPEVSETVETTAEAGIKTVEEETQEILGNTEIIVIREDGSFISHEMAGDEIMTGKEFREQVYNNPDRLFALIALNYDTLVAGWEQMNVTHIPTIEEFEDMRKNGDVAGLQGYALPQNGNVVLVPGANWVLKDARFFVPKTLMYWDTLDEEFAVIIENGQFDEVQEKLQKELKERTEAIEAGFAGESEAEVDEGRKNTVLSYFLQSDLTDDARLQVLEDAPYLRRLVIEKAKDAKTSIDKEKEATKEAGAS